MYSYLSALLTALSLFPAVHAQFVRRRRPTLGRIIAGVVIGGLCFIIFIVLVILTIRRRRRARVMAIQPGYPSQPQGYYQPTGWYGPHPTAAPPQNGFGGYPHAPQNAYGSYYGQDGPKYTANQKGYYPPDVPPPAYVKGESQNAGAFRT